MRLRQSSKLLKRAVQLWNRPRLQQYPGQRQQSACSRSRCSPDPQTTGCSLKTCLSLFRGPVYLSLSEFCRSMRCFVYMSESILGLCACVSICVCVSACLRVFLPVCLRACVLVVARSVLCLWL